MIDNSKSSGTQAGSAPAPAPRPGDTEGLSIVRRQATTIITLDRPAALNAITIAMRHALLAAFPPFARDADFYAALVRAAPAGGKDKPVFCAGGDIRQMAGVVARDAGAAADALNAEHRLCWLVECFSKPTVSLIDGLVVGAGVGFTLYGTHRVAGPRYGFSMPETRIGFFPNCGVAHAFARMPDEIGIYLGLTGRRIGAADAYALGLVTHCIGPDCYDEIETTLSQARPVDPVLDRLHQDPGQPELYTYRATIRHCFGAATVEEIVSRLEDVAGAGAGPAEFARTTLNELARASPLALVVTLRHIREAAALDLGQVLERDCRLAAAFFQARDFATGVARVLGGETDRPFFPATLAEVTPAMVERMFAPVPGRNVHLPTRAEMQAARV